MKWRSVAFLTMCAVLVLCQSVARPQSSTATITGRVLDPASALVPNVTVTVLNVDTQIVSKVVTNDDGLYTVSGLPPGNYRIEAAKLGFKTVIKPDVILHLQDVVAINFSMTLGSVTESVTVEGGSPILNTTDGSVSTVVDRQFVENVPLNGRSFQSLLTLAPGVSVVSSFRGVGYGGEITVNGQRSESNYFTVDGVSANTGTPATTFGLGAGYAGAVAGETTMGTTQSLVSIDALQEFRASTSTYSAEYGRTPGGQFSFATRSGANDWHGSAYDFLRNDALDANNWFNNSLGIPRTAERQNDFGGTLGGPVVIPGVYNGANKTFFFFSYEGLRLLQPQAPALVPVPDATLRENAPRAIQPVLNSFPVSNAGEDGLNDGFAFYKEAVSNPSSLDNVSVRMDHTFNDKFKIFGRYADTPSETSSYAAAFRSSSSFTGWTLTLGATNLITSSQSNELRFNIAQNSANGTSVSTSLGGATPLNLNSLPGPNGAGFPIEASALAVCLCYGQFQIAGPSQQRTTQRQYNVTDTYAYTVGTHNLRFGVDWRRLASRASPINPLEYVEYDSEASVLANSADFAEADSESPSPIEPVYTNFSGFAQDEWKVTRRLSLSLGLRWDVDPAPGNAIGPSPYTVTQINNLATTQLAPRDTPLWKTTWNNFAPRLGVAYQLRKDSEYDTVVRGGFGIFYDMGNTNGSLGFNNGVGFASTAFYFGTSFPLTSAQLQTPAPSVAPPYNGFVNAFDPSLKLPYTLQWNVAVQQAFGRKQAITWSYVGSAGRRLLTQFEYTPAGLGNPNFTSFLYVTQNRASSNYNALQVQYQKQLSHGLQALASYTWSHSIDNASSNFTIYELLRASSDFDIRHNFQAALVYDIPGRFSSHLLSAVITHWGLDTRVSARSAMPVDIVGSQSVDAASQQNQQFHPNLVLGQPLYLYGSQYPGGRVINYNAFIAAPKGVEGNVPRNLARSFGAAQVDLSLRREFPIYERLRLQFRAEAFNVLNHANFGAMYNQLSRGPNQFGRAYDTLNNSLGGLSALYQIGGPRSLQLALKVIF